MAKEEAQLEELALGWLASMAGPESAQNPEEEAGASVSATSEALAQDKARVVFAETAPELLAAMREPLGRCAGAAVIVATPTSGWVVVGKYMEAARDLDGMYKKRGGVPWRPDEDAGDHSRRQSLGSALADPGEGKGLWPGRAPS